MAWEILKAAVAEVIKANGNNEITGDVLQDTLLSIINNLGENALFAGVAIPTTVPGNPDGNVFYLASTVGTYSNFSALSIGSNEIAVFKNSDGVWNKQSIEILHNDSVLTNNIANLAITGAKIAEGAETIKSWKPQPYISGSIVNYKGVDYFASTATLSTDEPSISSKWIPRLGISFGANADLIQMKNLFIDGSVSCGVVGNDRVISTSTINKYIEYSCSYGDRFRVKAQGGNGLRRWAFTTSAGKIISISDNPGTVFDEVIIAPPFSDYLYVNNVNTNADFNCAKLVNDTRLDKVIKSNGLNIYSLKDTVEKQWSRTNGSIVENVITGNSVYSSRGMEFTVTEGEVFQIFTYSSSTRKPFYITNSAGEIISESSSFGDNTVTPLKLKIPANGVKLYINLVNSLGLFNSAITSKFMVVRYSTETDTRQEALNTVIGTQYAQNVKMYSIINNNGSTLVAQAYDATFSSLQIPCAKGDIFVIKGVGGFSGRLYTFATTGGTIFTTEPIHKAIASADFTSNAAVIVAPASASILVVNVRMDSSVKSIIKVSKDFNNIILNGGSSIFEDITATAESAVDIANEAKSIAEGVNTTINNITYQNGSGYEWFFDNATKRADYMLARQVLTAKAHEMIETNRVNLKSLANANGGSVVFQHDASCQYHNALSKLFTTCIANDVNTEDSSYSEHVYTVLYVLEASSLGVIDSSSYAKHVIAKHGDTIDGIAILSGVGVPNSYLVGDLLHIIFSAQGTDTKWYLFHQTFNCVTDTLGTAEVCQMDDVPMTCEKIASYDGLTTNNMISINASIAFLNGYYYGCCCSVGFFSNGLILRTADFTTWEFVKKPTFAGIASQAMFEGAMAAFGGNLFLALRQNDWDTKVNTNPVILAKLDPVGNVLDTVLVPSTTSRPAWFLRGTASLHLAVSKDNRFSTCIMQVNTTNLRDSVPLQDVANYGNYLSVAPRTENLQFICWTTGTTGVNVSSMNYGKDAPIAVMNSLMEAITI